MLTLNTQSLYQLVVHKAIDKYMPSSYRLIEMKPASTDQEYIYSVYFMLVSVVYNLNKR